MGGRATLARKDAHGTGQVTCPAWTAAAAPRPGGSGSIITISRLPPVVALRPRPAKEPPMRGEGHRRLDPPLPPFG